MRFRHAALLLPALLLAAAPVAADRRTDERLDRIEQRLSRQEDSQVLLEMLRRLDALEQEVRQLRGEAETNRHDLDGIKERQRTLYLDVDRRLQSVEAGARAAPVAAPPVAAVPAAPRTEAAAEMPSPAPQAAIPAPVAEPTAAEAEEYRRAFGLLQEGRNAEAASAFGKFMKDYPDSSYGSNAQYWLGEAHYVSKEYREALVEFRKVLDRYPGSNKVPDALLKLGFTHYELGEHEAARKSLTEARDRFPGSTVARLADQRLRRMSDEGR